MISPATASVRPSASETAVQALVRYGCIPQVARYLLSPETAGSTARGTEVVIRTDRGLELGRVLETLPKSAEDDGAGPSTIERIATKQDLQTHHTWQLKSAQEFGTWQQRIQEWDLQLELIELERTLADAKIILYVLNEQNAETTRLALLAAAAGLGIVHVQPVSAEGIVNGSDGGGCGSGCGCSH